MTKIFHFALFVSLMFLFINTKSQSKYYTKEPEYYKGKHREFMIFSLDTVFKADFPAAKQFIVPTKNSVETADKELKEQFTMLLKDAEKRRICILSDTKLENYNLQIAAYLDKDGREILVLTAAHPSLTEVNVNWKKRFIYSVLAIPIAEEFSPVKWFSVLFDLKSKTFSEFTVFCQS